MRKLPRKLRTALYIIIPLLPLVLGFTAYMMTPDGEAFGLMHKVLDSLYYTVRLYTISLDYPEVAQTPAARALLDAARWGAVLVMAAALLKLLRSIALHARTAIAASHKHSVSLYGDAAPVAMMKAELGGKAIACELHERFGAANHVLAFRDSAQLYRFLGDHYGDLTSRRDARLFLYANDPIHPGHINPRVFINNMTRTCARNYWKKHWLRDDEYSVALVGFGKYGGELLSQALLVNVFLTDDACCYHVFGDAAEYRALHGQLDKVASIDARQPKRDAIFFHSEPWYEQLDELSKADRIILCDDREEENLRVLDALVYHGVQKPVYVRFSDGDVLKALGKYDDKPPIIPFGTDRELYTVDCVTNTTTLNKGRLVHANYLFGAGCAERSGTGGCGKSGPVDCLTCERFISDWNDKTSDYARSSSIAQADHIPVKIRALLQSDIDDTNARAAEAYSVYASLTPEQRMPYMALEHRRWMRFMCLRGWRYAPVRDNTAHCHPLMIPFDELPQNQQIKDEAAYEILKEVGPYEQFKKQML